MPNSNAKHVFKRFLGTEDGAGTAFALFIFVMLCMLLGLSVDGTNAWRNRTMVTSVADIAAHGGLVALARGASDEEVRDEVERYVQANLPQASFGALLIRDEDIFIAGYDRTTGQVDYTSTDRNAVVVRLRRGADRGNPIGTYLLKFAGVTQFELEAFAVATFDTLAQCGLQEGIYAHGQVTLTSQTQVGAGICIHSQDHVWLPQQNTFAEGSIVSMPNLSDCKNKCTDSANPGINAIEANLDMPDFRQMVLDAHAEFQQPLGNNDRKNEAFTGIANADAARQALIDAGVFNKKNAPELSVGDVVNLSKSDFDSMASLPAGVVYNVDCPSNGGKNKTTLTFNGSTGRMDGSVLITDCALHFGDGSYVVGSTIVSIRDQNNSALSADSHITIGDPSGTCNAANTTTIMSLSGMNVPAAFVMSNVTIYAGDDVNLASATSSSQLSRGMEIYAQGKVHVAAQHNFGACNTQANSVGPDLSSLRLVLPGATAQVAQANP